MIPATNPDRLLTRYSSALQFFLSAAWLMIAFTLGPGIGLFLAARLSPMYTALVQQLVVLLLLLMGFSLLGRSAGLRHSIRGMGWVQRKTVPQEFGRGFALAWTMVALGVLPLVFVRGLHPVFDWSASAWNRVAVGIAVAAVSALAIETGLRGYPFQRLCESIGKAWASVVMAVLFALFQMQAPHTTAISFCYTFFAGILLATAYLRTRGLWLPWGIHFGSVVSMGVLLGLPVSGGAEYASVVQSSADGPIWLTGGLYGPEGALFAVLVLLGGFAILLRMTREYDWNYNFHPIVGAGHPMDVAPPAEHTRMEEDAAKKPAPLVQILPITPQGFSETNSSIPPK